jgi:short-subunit dehydrogenase
LVVVTEEIMRGTSQNRLPLALKFAAAGVAAAGCSYALRRYRRIDFSGKTVLISGASRGLGLELARHFAAHRANVVLMARDQERLTEAARELKTYGIEVSTRQCDVTQPEEARRAIRSVIDEFRSIDVLVNNAGIIQVGPAENMNRDDYADALAVHFWAPLNLTAEVLPYMKGQGSGRIVNITSIGGKVAVPHLAPYVASKFALVGFSESMRAELIKDGIYVTTVVPGLMRTGSHINAFFKGQHQKEFALFSIANASPFFSTASERAARQIVEACRYGKAELIITPQARLLHLANSLFPNITAEVLGLISRSLPSTRPGEGNALKRGWQSHSFMAPSVLTRTADRVIRRNQEQPRSVPGRNGSKGFTNDSAPERDRS